MSSKPAFFLLGILFPMAMACHGQNAVPTQEVNADSTGISLQWMPDGNTLLVNDQWIYNPATKLFQPLPRPAEKTSQATWSVQPSLDGQQLLWFDGERRLATAAAGHSQHAIQSIPNWLSLKDEQRLINIVFWLNNFEIFVQQIDSEKPTTQTCAILDAAKQQWTKTPGGCLVSAFAQLFRVTPLTGGRYAVYSSGEGQNAVEIMQFDPRSEARRHFVDATLQTDSPPAAQISMHNTALAMVLYPCELTLNESKPHCKANTENQWAVYEWTMSPVRLRQARANLPEGIALSTAQRQYAWINQNALCVGDPETATQSCSPLPVRR